MADNIGKDINNQNEKGKTFYSVNLTEGRIFVIFISIILILVIIFFGLFLLIAKINSTNSVSRRDNENIITNSELNFYDGSIKKDETTDKKNDLTENIPINKSINDNEKLTSENNDEKKESTIILDNSEVLYSSKFKNIENRTISSKKVSNEKKIVKSTTTTINNTIKTRKYVIQIGSYVNKEIALEIENFYKKAGYPTYIQNYPKDGKIYYRLRIGPFKDKKIAESYLISLKQSKYGKNSYISIINNI